MGNTAHCLALILPLLVGFFTTLRDECHCQKAIWVEFGHYSAWKLGDNDEREGEFSRYSGNGYSGVN